jgi:hypothetical protein
LTMRRLASSVHVAATEKLMLYLLVTLGLRFDGVHSFVTPHHHSRLVPTPERISPHSSPKKARLSLNMALVPLPVDDLEDFLVVGPPSGPQYATYWGRTKVRTFDSTTDVFVFYQDPSHPIRSIARTIQSGSRISHCYFSWSILFVFSKFRVGRLCCHVIGLPLCFLGNSVT